jgi:hypothetical protein
MNIAIIIQHPERLKKLFPPKNGLPEGTIKASYGNFGLIPYGHSMVSKFLKPNNQFHNRWVDYTTRNLMGLYVKDLSQIFLNKRSMIT